MVDKRSMPKKEKKERMSGLSAKQITKSFKEVFQGRNADQEQAKKQTLALAKQVQLTQKIISQQSDKLKEVAKEDSSVADFLKDFDMIRFDRIADIANSIEAGEEVSAKQGAEVVETLKRVQDNFGALDFKSLELNAKEMITFTRESIKNNKLTRDFRRNLVSDLTDFIGSQENLSEDQTNILSMISRVQESGLEFTKEQTDSIDNLLGSLGDTKIEEIKSRGTLDQINSKMGGFLANQEDIEEKLDTQNAQGKTLAEMLEGGFDSDLGKGLLDTAFAMLGLPGFGIALTQGAGIFKTAGSTIMKVITKLFGKEGVFSKIFSKLSAIGKSVGSFFSKGMNVISKIFGKGGVFAKVFAKIGGIAGKVGKFFKPIGTVLSKLGGLGKVAKVAGKGAKLIPGIGQAIAVVVGLFSAISGFFNAGEISGKKEEAVTMFDKINASISSLLSSLTFGFIGTKTIFKKIDQFKNFIKDFDIQATIDGVIKTVTGLFSSIWEKVKGLVTSILEVDPKELLKNAASGLTFGLSDKIGNFFSGDEEEKANAASNVSTVGQEMTRGIPLSRDNLQPLMRTTPVNNQVRPQDLSPRQKPVQNTTVVAPQPVNQSPPPGPKKRESIDDMRLSALNLGLMD